RRGMRVSFEFLWTRQQDEVGFAAEDDHVAAVVHGEALGRDMAEWPGAVDRFMTLSRAVQNVDMGAVGVELVAAILIEHDIAVKVQELRLGLIGPRIAGKLDPIAA